MEYNNIRALLEKYWACETTEAEEETLRVFYAAHEGPLPADLREAAALFQYFHAEGESGNDEPFVMPELFTDRPAPWASETKIIRPFWYGWMKYAAILVAAIGIVYSVNQYIDKRNDAGSETAFVFEDTYSDPKLAYEQTQRALKLLSRNLNKGKREMERLNYFNEAKEIIEGNHN